MVFSSLIFLVIFLPLVLLCLRVFPTSFHNAILLVFSLLFYAWGEPKYILLMLLIISLGYFTGIWMSKYPLASNKRKCVLALVITLDLVLLGFFKYADLIISGANQLVQGDMPLLHIALPLGISFYTFQTMSYSIDVYRGDVNAQKSWLKFATYVSLFPQLVAGPIVRYHDIEKELEYRKISADEITYGCERFLWGLAKKVLLANPMGLLSKSILESPLEHMPTITAWVALLAFTFQIYFDFSGYSDMAIGLGRVLGFHFLENFNYPYMAHSIKNFWERWHISLSEWFKQYLYIPLGGNKGSTLRKGFNLFLVWLLTGLWHGAHYNFILWGLYYFVLISSERAYRKYVSKKDSPPSLSGNIATIFAVMVGWGIFMMTDFIDLLAFFKALFHLNGQGFLDEVGRFFTLEYLPILIFAVFASTPYPMKYLSLLKNDKIGKYIYQFVLIFIGIWCIAGIVKDTYNPFLYFRF
ncbi:MAG: MBOAT family protein [Tissierellia bacterium]|nr:MBOAT family protein [Tissierellia bacterium]